MSSRDSGARFERRPADPSRMPRPREIVISRHASHQHHTRYCPELTAEQAWRKLLDGRARGWMQRRRPDWLMPTDDLGHKVLTVGHLIIDHQLCLPVQIHDGRYVARTCLIRGYDPIAAKFAA